MPAPANSRDPSTPKRASLEPDLLRPLCLLGQMPLASAANVAPILGTSEVQARERLQRLHRSGWLESVRQGMLERAQDRWFLTRHAARSLYAADEAHSSDIGPSPLSPFIGLGWDEVGDNYVHGHLPWTVTARGIRILMRRLATLELLYRQAPDLLRNGDLVLPADSATANPELRMADFRLLRHSGWYHAIAHYGDHYWVTFTFVGLHATERTLRRKYEHRYWGLDCYSSEFDRCELATDRVFYEDPEFQAEPSAQVVLAVDSWAAQLARRAFARRIRPLICTPEGRWGEPVELRHSKDGLADPIEPLEIGQAERMIKWRSSNRDLAVISDPIAFSVFTVVAEHPGMHQEWISELVGKSGRVVGSVLARCIDEGLIDQLDERCYLAPRGMRRAANLSRVIASSINSRHGMYLDRALRQRLLAHDDGVNSLVVNFARESVSAFAGWRGEINLPGITQIKPDLLVVASEGPFGSGPHCVEYERGARGLGAVARKLRPYLRCAATGRPIPLLMVCDNETAAGNFTDFSSNIPLAVAHMAALRDGRLTGESTVWRRRGGTAVPLHCR